MSRVLKTKGNKITKKYNELSHKGIDIVGTNYSVDYIVAHSDGIVTSVRTDYKKTDKTGSSYGNYVKIKHSNGMYTLYAHLKYGSVKVKKGDKVTKGQVIAYMGATGHSTGVHLHFEVRNNKDVRVDPTAYINADLPSNNNWTPGKYKLLVSKAIRTSHDLGNNIVLVGRCMNSVKPRLTSSNANKEAYYKVGTVVDITEIFSDSTSRVWGKLQNCWIVLCNKDGTPQATKC